VRKALPLGAVAASAAEGADLVWRTGFYEPLGGIETIFAVPPHLLR
jgi:hypothetical protein